MNKPLQLKTIKEYNDYMGVATRHPLVNVIEGRRIPHPIPHARKHVGMYLIFLKELKCRPSAPRPTARPSKARDGA